MSPLASALAGSLPLLAALVLFVLAAFVWKTGSERVPNRIFAALYACSATKSLSEGLLPMAARLHAEAPSFPQAVFWYHLALLSAFFMLPLLVLFALEFPQPAPFLVKRPWTAALLFLPSLALSAALLPGAAGSLRGLVTSFNALSLAATLLALVLLWRSSRSTLDPIARTRAEYVTGAIGSVVLATFAVATAQFLHSPLQTVLLEWVTPLVELAAAGVIGYAILKYQLLGIELKVKTGARVAFTGLTILAMLFVTKEVFEQAIEPFFAFTEVSWLLTAVVGTLVFRPVERAVNRLANQFFPATLAPSSEYQATRARDVYHAQVLNVLRDATITERERRLLDHLRDQLGLAAAQAGAIETDVERLLAAGRGKVSGAAPTVA